MFGSLNVLNNSWLYLSCHTPFSCFVPKIHLSTSVSNRLNIRSSVFHTVQISEAYVSTGLMSTLYINIFVFLEVEWANYEVQVKKLDVSPRI